MFSEKNISKCNKTEEENEEEIVISLKAFDSLFVNIERIIRKNAAWGNLGNCFTVAEIGRQTFQMIYECTTQLIALENGYADFLSKFPSRVYPCGGKSISSGGGICQTGINNYYDTNEISRFVQRICSSESEADGDDDDPDPNKDSTPQGEEEEEDSFPPPAAVTVVVVGDNKDYVVGDCCTKTTELEKEDICSTTTTAQQQARTLVQLYAHAKSTHKTFFKQFLEKTFRKHVDVSRSKCPDKMKSKVIFSIRCAPMKKIIRAVEKIVVKCERPVDLCDIVRGSIVAHSMEDLVYLLGVFLYDFGDLQDDMKDRSITTSDEESSLPKSSQSLLRICRVKNRFASPTAGGWTDCTVNFFFVDDPNRHVCELQFIHNKLLHQRKTLGGHQFYAAFRCAYECLELGCLSYGCLSPELLDCVLCVSEQALLNDNHSIGNKAALKTGGGHDDKSEHVIQAYSDLCKCCLAENTASLLFYDNASGNAKQNCITTPKGDTNNNTNNSSTFGLVDISLPLLRFPQKEDIVKYRKLNMVVVSLREGRICTGERCHEVDNNEPFDFNNNNCTIVTDTTDTNFNNNLHNNSTPTNPLISQVFSWGGGGESFNTTTVSQKRGGKRADNKHGGFNSLKIDLSHCELTDDDVMMLAAALRVNYERYYLNYFCGENNVIIKNDFVSIKAKNYCRLRLVLASNLISREGLLMFLDVLHDIEMGYQIVSSDDTIPPSPRVAPRDEEEIEEPNGKTNGKTKSRFVDSNIINGGGIRYFIQSIDLVSNPIFLHIKFAIDLVERYSSSNRRTMISSNLVSSQSKTEESRETMCLSNTDETHSRSRTSWSSEKIPFCFGKINIRKKFKTIRGTTLMNYVQESLENNV